MKDIKRLTVDSMAPSTYADHQTPCNQTCYILLLHSRAVHTGTAQVLERYACCYCTGGRGMHSGIAQVLERYYTYWYCTGGRALQTAWYCTGSRAVHTGIAEMVEQCILLLHRQ